MAAANCERKEIFVCAAVDDDHCGFESALLRFYKTIGLSFSPHKLTDVSRVGALSVEMHLNLVSIFLLNSLLVKAV